jgi:predicted short-subunit dehydrogenase-like oxidoreductase (DUF2520 family)
MRKSLKWNIAIIGAGKVGSVLGRLLVENGDRIVAIVSRRSASAKKAGKYLQCRAVSTSLDSLPPATDVVFITTPHSAVEQVAEDLSRCVQLQFERLAVCHASGMLTADILDPVRRLGSKVFSFHPLQTFPRDFAPRDMVHGARHIYYGVDGSPDALLVARQLAKRLGGRIIEIPPEMRAFYHAACVVASNHLTALISVLERMFKVLNTKEENFYTVFKPILMATMKNIESSSPAEALSGPVARGGVETVADHFKAVKIFAPEILPYFAEMSRETVHLASAKGSIDDNQSRDLFNLIQSFLHTNPHIRESL